MQSPRGVVLPAREPIRTYVLLRIDQRFPLPTPIAELCANRIFCHESVLDVQVVAAGALLHDVTAALGADSPAAPQGAQS